MTDPFPLEQAAGGWGAKQAAADGLERAGSPIEELGLLQSQGEVDRHRPVTRGLLRHHDHRRSAWMGACTR
jgi:hypothetical protein